ncbi:MAG: hypothetical protein M3O70_10425 [Actinomycetota bacterium]|nr:hypothetical protein [Actinomycetota bacterium]
MGLQVEGHLVLGANLASCGDVHTGLHHLDRAIALFDPYRHRPGRLRLGASPGVVARTTSAFLLWLVGYPDRAVQRARSALELARQLNHPFTLAYALFHVGLLDLWRRDLASVHERASGALDVAEEHDYQVWRAVAQVLEGVAMTGLGRPEEGLATTERGIALYQGLKTPPVFWPVLLSIRAGAFALAGRPAEGLNLIEEAIATTSEADFAYPEYAMLKGDLLLGTCDAGAAVPWFQSAFDAAGEVGVRMSQLRAATRLTRLWRAAGKDPDAELLRGVYQTLTEGFDTPDLVEARAVLGDLDGPPARRPT